ncbi:RelE/StbE family addiction module toxin [Clostridia bacterium]|nr:RelE/StbE family addiction module toxin [Clostridia bacterium]
MKFNPIYQNSFKKSLKLCNKRGYPIDLLEEIMIKLQNGVALDASKNRPHQLSGTNPQIIECHITSDWLLEYRYNDDNIIFIDTGTHSDLFK